MISYYGSLEEKDVGVRTVGYSLMNDIFDKMIAKSESKIKSMQKKVIADLKDEVSVKVVDLTESVRLLTKRCQTLEKEIRNLLIHKRSILKRTYAVEYKLKINNEVDNG